MVNDGGPDLSDLDVPSHGCCDRILVVQLPLRSGISRARNAGVVRARYPLVGFLDDDTTAEFDWLYCLRRSFSADRSVAAVVGKIDPVGVRHPLDRLRQLTYDSRHLDNLERSSSTRIAARHGRTPLPGVHQVDYLSGGNCAVRRDLLLAIDGFDPAYVVMQDRELAMRLVARGGAIVYEPAMVVRHDNEATFSHLWRGRFRGGRFAVRLARQHPVAYGEGWLARRFSTQYGHGPGRMLVTKGALVTAAASASLVAYSCGVGWEMARRRTVEPPALARLDEARRTGQEVLISGQRASENA